MSEYVPPVDEMRFVLRHIADCAAADEDLIGQVLDQAAGFAGTELAPLKRIGDTHSCRLDNGAVRTPPGFHEAYQRFVEGGWNGIAFDPAVGGQGLPRPVAAAVSEMWHAANLA